ncbi:MAG: LysR family transcriptional regulator [Pseudomonadota bacterium]
MPARLEIDALRALLAVARLGGVTRAAEHLGLSQSAVSHKMRRLEHALNCELLMRRPGAPLLTETGTRLVDYARRIVDLHDEALTDLGPSPLAGTIRLGMTEDTAISAVTRLVGRFTRLYPSVSVRTRTAQSLVVQDWLNAGELDIAVLQVFETDLLETDVRVFRDTLHWVKSKDFALDASRPVPFLSFDPQCFYRQWGVLHGQSSGHRLETVLECPSAAGIQSAVRSGLGVALLNGMHLTPDLAVIENIFPPPPDIVYVARIHPRRKSAPVRALVDEVAREFRAATPLRTAS